MHTTDQGVGDSFQTLPRRARDQPWTQLPHLGNGRRLTCRGWAPGPGPVWKAGPHPQHCCRGAPRPAGLHPTARSTGAGCSLPSIARWPVSSQVTRPLVSGLSLVSPPSIGCSPFLQMGRLSQGAAGQLTFTSGGRRVLQPLRPLSHTLPSPKSWFRSRCHPCVVTEQHRLVPGPWMQTHEPPNLYPVFQEGVNSVSTFSKLVVIPGGQEYVPWMDQVLPAQGWPWRRPDWGPSRTGRSSPPTPPRPEEESNWIRRPKSGSGPVVAREGCLSTQEGMWLWGVPCRAAGPRAVERTPSQCRTPGLWWAELPLPSSASSSHGFCISSWFLLEASSRVLK